MFIRIFKNTPGKFDSRLDSDHSGTVIALILRGTAMSDTEIKILLASDSTLFLDGLRKILEHDKGIEVVSAATNLNTLNALIKDLGPELLFVDNRQFNCDIEKLIGTKIIRARKIKVIVLSEDNVHTSPNLISVDQNTTASELIEIIKSANDEKTEFEDIKPKETEFSNITKTELRIIKLIAAGETNKEISEKLSIAEKTVKAHISRIFEKLHVQNRHQLMLLGNRNRKSFEMNP